MSRAINVWREYKGQVQFVGLITSGDGGMTFSYDAAYDGEAISASLPKEGGPASDVATSRFFSALIPEGSAKEELARTLRAGRGEFLPFLEHLRDESIGALLFSVDDEEPYVNPEYTKADPDFFDRLSARPLETAVATMGKTRLSLSGAMAKVGLYRDPETGEWFYPSGGAPSTHILKAADGERFPLETVCEALCLRAAKKLDYPVAECELVAAEGGEPVLALQRYDRVFDEATRVVDGHTAPNRLHQEDFVQALSSPLKYEPTDGGFLRLLTAKAGHLCVNSFGESHLALEYTLFDFLVGNCDNHLKNYALLYSPDWSIRELAPLYDVVSTVLYPDIYLEMGVSFGGDRRIDHVTRELASKAFAACAIPEGMAWNAFDNLVADLPGALEAAADEISAEGFTQVRGLLPRLLGGVSERGLQLRH